MKTNNENRCHTFGLKFVNRTTIATCKHKLSYIWEQENNSCMKADSDEGGTYVQQIQNHLESHAVSYGRENDNFMWS